MYFFNIIYQELNLVWRRGGEWLYPLWFFLLVVTVFSFAINSDQRMLTVVGPGIVWVAVLLTTLLSLEGLFRDDVQDGTLEQVVLLPQPLAVSVLGKVIAQWWVSSVPLLLLSPLSAWLFSLEWFVWQALFYTLLVGTPTLMLLGSIGRALTVRLQRGGLLLTLLVLPWFIPVLLLSLLTIEMASLGGDIRGLLMLLTALLLASITFAPFASASALRLSLG